jgi:hypothetical protein
VPEKTLWGMKQVRVARPTDQLAAVIRFYHEGLGLPILSHFEGHSGYDGVILGMPDATYQVEFTQHEAGSPCPAPTTDNLLVFYAIEREHVDILAARLGAMGYSPVPPENPWWETRSITIPDPDGWRVVLVYPEREA